MALRQTHPFPGMAPSLLSALFLTAALFTRASAQSADKAELYTGKEYSNAFAMPEDNPALPNVLLIGDSISIGYTLDVRKRLKGKADVFRIPTNGQASDFGLKNIDKWLDGRKWDVIHFNWGLWDLCYRNPKVKTQGNRDKVNGKLSVTPEQYEQNIETIVTRLKATGARLIWASTTVVPEGEAGRIVGDEVKYNMIAARVMQRHGIPTDDLHALSKSFAGKFSAGPHDVHFTAAGYQLLANQVAAEITRLLETKTSPPPVPRQN